jgi:hypothetical protein
MRREGCHCSEYTASNNTDASKNAIEMQMDLRMSVLLALA